MTAKPDITRKMGYFRIGDDPPRTVLMSCE
jgi:hypothetical protein